MARRSGRGKTPDRVIDLLSKAVSNTSQTEMAKTLGTGVAAVNRYLKGVGEPTQETLEKLSGYFKVSVAWLRGEMPGLEFEDAKKVYENELLRGSDEEYNQVDADLRRINSQLGLKERKALRDVGAALTGKLGIDSQEIIDRLKSLGVQVGEPRQVSRPSIHQNGKKKPDSDE